MSGAEERDTDTEGEHHSYDLRFKQRAVGAAKKSIITAAVVWSRHDNKRPFRYKRPSHLNAPSTDVARRYLIKYVHDN